MQGDLHIHMILDGVDFRAAIGAHKKQPCDEIIRARLQEYQKCGVDFLRDGGDAWGVSLRAREMAGEFGIDYRSPVFPIYKKGHYGSFIGRGFADFDEYRRLIGEVQAQNGDFVKLMISGLIDFTGSQALTEDGLTEGEIRRLIAYAHEAGFAVMVHANGDRAVNAAMDAGVESVEHGAFLSEATLLRLAKTRTLWVPTLSTIGNLIGCGRYPDSVLLSLLKEQREKVTFVAKNGGLIGLGSDAGAYRVFHGRGISDEREYLREISDDLLQEAEDFVKKLFSGEQ